MATTVKQVTDGVLASTVEQLRDLQPVLEKPVELAEILARLNQLNGLLDGSNEIPADATTNSMLKAAPNATPGIIDRIENLIEASGTTADVARVLVSLYLLRQHLQKYLQDLLDTKSILSTDRDRVTELLLNIIGRVRQILNYRPDVGAIMDDLAAIKSLGGGPADAVAFHDFHVLQVAFRDVWMHAFSENLKFAAAALYEQTVQLYEDSGLQVPNFDAVRDIQGLADFVNGVRRAADPTYSPATVPNASVQVQQYFPEAVTIWSLLSDGQRQVIEIDASAMDFRSKNESPGQRFAADKACREEVAAIIKHPLGAPSRITRLIAEIGKELSEPYAFDVFAPDSYNYGLMITYRQKWEPGPYQAGNLVATIPLAPGETRKYSKKRVVKESVSKKMLEKSMESRSLQTSDTSRAEVDILNKVSTATNFKMTTHGSFNIGIGSIENTSQFGANAAAESTKTKKELHEATLKAAEEYRRERSLEIDTSSSVEIEETMSGEISNPNNEITVTYLFYELQRRYQIHEYLYRVRPVILVAQDVPSPHEIDEAWLAKYQWILARVLLDDSFRPALTYLTTGFAGDEVSIEILKGQWQTQQSLVEKLEALVTEEKSQRDNQREALVKNALDQDLIPEMPGALKIFTMGIDPTDPARNALEAYSKAGEARLKYTEEALADAQGKLRQASSVFEKVTKDLADAMKQQYTRDVNIDLLRVHVKQNILHYMQAIWAHEVADQRYFRLYNKKVICPVAQANCTVPSSIDSRSRMLSNFANGITVTFENKCVPAIGGGGVGGMEHELVEVADLDNPLGFKGNYIIFPLKDDCALTDYMLADYIDNFLGVKDPDGSGTFDSEDFDQQWQTALRANDQAALATLKGQLLAHIKEMRQHTDEIIVPTGQMFIEALPGAHPLLEDFKLLHRFEDVRKVRAEVRHAELENLRLASRLAAGQSETRLLEDPDIEKKVIFEGSAPSVTEDTG